MFRLWKLFKRKQLSTEVLILKRAKLLYPKASLVNILQVETDEAMPDKIVAWVNVDSSPHVVSINKGEYYE